MFKRYWWMLLVMLPIGMVIGFMVAAVITYMMPKMYESWVILEVKPHINPLPQKGIQYSDVEKLYAEKILAAVERTMLRRDRLLGVSQALDLPDGW